MALRIGQTQAASKPAVLPEDEPKGSPRLKMANLTAPAPKPPAEQVDDSDPDGDGDTDTPNKASQAVARYLGPDDKCGACVHFSEDNGNYSCLLVADPIVPDGVCALFEADTDNDASDADEGDNEEA